MVRYQARLQNKQAFLFRLVDVANELFAMAASVSRAHALGAAGLAGAAEARQLADLFCRMSRRRIEQLFAELWDNDDTQRYRAGVDVLAGRYEWMEKGILGIGDREAAAPAAAARTAGADARPEKVAVGAS
jgi:hypothetical protein